MGSDTYRWGMTQGSDIVICPPLRTPVGRMGGALAAVPVTDLATGLLRALVERTGRSE
jgi:acetyl-CoA C-acetyltransferase